MLLPETQVALTGFGSSWWSWLYCSLEPGWRGGPGGGVTAMMVSRISPNTAAITNSEIRIPFQSRDFCGSDTSSYGVRRF